MKSSVVSTQKNSFQVRVAALVLLLLALVIPQLVWADHASDHSVSQFEEMPAILARQAYVALVEKYESEELVYHEPGRRDDRTFSTSPSEAYAALVEQYRTGELEYHAPGR